MVHTSNVHRLKNVQNVEIRMRQTDALGYISVTLSNNNRKKEEGSGFVCCIQHVNLQGSMNQISMFYLT